LGDPLQIQLDQTAYALDSTIIDLCLTLFPWAKFRKRKAAVKLHTLLDLRAIIPTTVIVTTGAVHDVNIMDELFWEPGSIYVMDRGYVDFSRLYRIQQDSAFFVTRAKKNFRCQRLYSHKVNKASGLRCDQTVVLCGFYAQKDYPDKLRRIRYFDQQTNKALVFLTQQLYLTGFDHRSTVSMPLAGRIILQMDQATSSHQRFLRHQRQCREDSDLDRHLDLRVGRHRQEALESRSQLVLNSTDFERDDYGKNSDLTSTFAIR
jgi:hypothetical protein